MEVVAACWLEELAIVNGESLRVLRRYKVFGTWLGERLVHELARGPQQGYPLTVA